MRFAKVMILVSVTAAVVAVSAAAFAVVVDPLPIGVVGTPYAYKPEIHGGGPPFAFYLEGGTLPQGMSIRQDDACICGTPQNSGTFVFNILGYAGVDNNPPSNQTDSPDFTLHIRPQVIIQTTSLKSAAVNSPYTATLVATGAGDFALQWSITAGSLPAGLTLAPDGTISGTPTTVGTSFFTARVKDADGGPRSVTQQYTLNVVSALTATAAAPPAAEVGRPFKTTVSATGGTPPVTWSATGLPDGVVIDPASGAIAGKPTAAGTFPAQATATDSGGQTATVSVTVEVARALQVVTLQLRKGKVGSTYAQKLRAIGGVSTRAWFRIGGKLPAGITLDGTTGALTGTPRKAGVFSFSVRVRDSLGARSTRSYTLTVRS